MADSFDWRAFLEEFSRELLEEERIRSGLTDEVVRSGWMGFEGASEGEIQDLERRLGIGLPQTYRRFLSVSNGWRTLGIYQPGLSSTSKVEWFRDHHLNVIATWQKGGRRASKKPFLPSQTRSTSSMGSGQASWSVRAGVL